MAISATAAGLRMGSHPSRSLTALLTLFSAQGGSWIEKPKPDGWAAASPRFADLSLPASYGLADGRGDFMYLSGGDEFERLGVYELIRRRCRYIVAVDGGDGRAAADAGLATLIRLCRVDFGLRIEIVTRPLEQPNRGGLSGPRVAIGIIHYDDVDQGGTTGVLVYVKLAITGDGTPDIPGEARTEPRSTAPASWRWRCARKEPVRARPLPGPTCRRCRVRRRRNQARRAGSPISRGYPMSSTFLSFSQRSSSGGPARRMLSRRTEVMRRRTWTGTLVRYLLWAVGGLIAAGVIYAVAAPFFEIGGVLVPRAELPPVHQLPQGWDDAVTKRFHRQSQGCKIMPLEWLLVLEQPVFTPLPVGRFAARDYLARYGFIYESDRPAAGGPDLPIGWAIEENYVAKYDDPPVETPTKMVGLTCAACHSNRLDIQGPDGRFKGVLIEGGSATIDLGSLESAVGKALIYTWLFPTRFARFARNVLAPNCPTTTRAR